MPELKDLREKRAKLLTDANEILTAVSGDNMAPEDEKRFDALHAEAEKVGALVRRIEQQEDALKAAEASRGRQAEPSPIGDDREHRVAVATDEEKREWPLRAWLLHPTDQTVPETWLKEAHRVGVDPSKTTIQLNMPRRAPRSLRTMDEWERRAQAVGTGAAGGFTVPEDFWRSLEESLLAFGGMREVSTVIRTDSGADLPVPTTDDTANKGVILAENTAVAEQDVTFGQIVLQAFKYSSKMIRVSVELLQDSAFNLSEFLGRALGERIGRITNDHFSVGTGTGEPRGIVVASSAGKTGLTGQTTSVIYDDLVDLQHSIDPAYRAQGARWMFHDTTLASLKKLKDLNNLPLWIAGMASREPDRILGDTYVINQSMAVMAANAKSILYGALQKYMIRDVRGVTLVRLDERFADFHQVAFLAFSRHDGDLIDAGTDPVKHYANSAT